MCYKIVQNTSLVENDDHRNEQLRVKGDCFSIDFCIHID